MQTLAYVVSLSATHPHTFDVQLTVPEPAANQQFALPVWIPGSYLIREFSRHLGPIRALQGGKRVAWDQLDKNHWRANNRAGQALVVQYSVYAHDSSVRTAWLEASRGFFNPTSLCLQVEGQTQTPHRLELAPSAATQGWQVVTGARPETTNKAGWGTYQFADYDELADSPFEMGPQWVGDFKASGVVHRLGVAHAAPSCDYPRLLRDTQAICEAHIAFWHGKRRPVHSHYAFLLAAVDDGYGGLEHQHSTALICKRADLPRLGDTSTPEGYQDLLGLISHEYFHTWNVKRLRPAELSRYDYGQENYTELLWFFEGFTSYYDDVMLVRAGLLGVDDYMRRLTKTLAQVMGTPGRQVQSVAQASFEAWTRYYRPDENTANSTVSYYTKGSLVALCLDLTLRHEGKGNLDQVMRLLWQRCKGGPMTEQDILAALAAVGERSYEPELAQWVHSTRELPVTDLLALHGIEVIHEPASTEQTWGLRAQEGNQLWVRQVLAGGPAAKAGLAPGDEWLAIEVGRGEKASTWRLQHLKDLQLYLGAPTGKSQKAWAWVARDKRVLRLPLTVPPASNKIMLKANPLASAQWLAWLVPPATRQPKLQRKPKSSGSASKVAL